MVYERALYSAGLRGTMIDPKTEKPRLSNSNLSFENFLSSLTVPSAPNSPNNERQPLSQQFQSIIPVVLPQCTLHNAGNDAFMCLFALQQLLEPTGTLVPSIKKGRGSKPGIAGAPMINSAAGSMNGGTPGPNMHYPGFGFATLPSPSISTSMPRLSSAYDLASEFGQMQISKPRATSGGGAYLTSLGLSRPSDNKNSKRISVFGNLNGLK